MIRRIGLACVCLLLGAAAPQPLWGTIGLAVPPATSGELGEFADAKLSVAQAMQAVLRARAGRVVEIGYASSNGVGFYNVLVAAGDGLHFLRVDPLSGAVGPGERGDIALTELDGVGRRDLEAIGAAKVGLRQAVARVMAQAGSGRVICAGVEQLGGIPQYYVTTVAGAKFGAWIVDPTTGLLSRPS
jgi:hypothetical protein